MLDMKASDLHLKSAKGPMVRVDGSMAEMPGRPPIGARRAAAAADAITPERNHAEFRETNDTDFAYELPKNGEGPGPHALQRVPRHRRRRAPCSARSPRRS